MALDKRKKRLARIGTILAIGILLLFLSFPLLSGFAAPFVPDSVQEPIGESMITSVGKDTPMCQAPEGRAALEKLAKTLAAASGTSKTFKIYVADGDLLNAFAAPGGHVVLFRAILDNAQSPNEVAGVLAHEMGHVVEDHPAKGLVEALGYGVFGLLIPGSNDDSAAIGQALLTNAHSRDDELDADRVGVEMLNAAGLNSRGLIAFFATLDAKGGSIPGALQFLSTHPTGDTRTEQLNDAVRDGKETMTDAEWTALKAICSTTGDAAPIAVGG